MGAQISVILIEKAFDDFCFQWMEHYRKALHMKYKMERKEKKRQIADSIICLQLFFFIFFYCTAVVIKCHLVSFITLLRKIKYRFLEEPLQYEFLRSCS